MAEGMPPPLTQADAQSLAVDVRAALAAISLRWANRADAAVVERELEHILRREAVARGPVRL